MTDVFSNLEVADLDAAIFDSRALAGEVGISEFEFALIGIGGGAAGGTVLPGSLGNSYAAAVVDGRPAMLVFDRKVSIDESRTS